MSYRLSSQPRAPHVGVLLALTAMLNVPGGAARARIGTAPHGVPRASQSTLEGTLAAMSAPGASSPRIRTDVVNGTPVFVAGRFRALRKSDPETTARATLERLESYFRAPMDSSHVQLLRNETDWLGYTHLRFGQFHQGVRVEGGTIVVHVAPDGWITSINGHLAPRVSVDVTPVLSADQAVVAGQDGLRDLLMGAKHPPIPESAWDFAPSRDPELRILAGRSAPEGVSQLLAWSLKLGRWEVFVDANTGDMVRYTLAGDLVPVTTYTYNGYTGSSTLVASNDPEYQAPDIDEEELAAHEAALEYASYLAEAFGRDSIDDNGYPLDLYVEYGSEDNAWWDGYDATFGTGWATRDVVAHEFTHGLSEYTSNLANYDASGALEESFSDILSMMTDRDDWLVGDEVVGHSAENPLRSFVDPHMGNRFHPEQAYDEETNCGQPAHYSEYVTPYDPICESTDDFYNGCVHFNSGIQNHAVYLMAEGGVVDGIVVEGVGRSDTEQVFYRTFATRLTEYPDYADARDNSLEACAELYGELSTTCVSTWNAWAAVGIGSPIRHVLHVAQNGTGDFTTIQAAVDAAESGDLIVIADGVYPESVQIASDGVLLIYGESENGTIVSGDGAQAAVTVLSGEVRIHQLSMSDAVGRAGGGLHCEDSSLELENVTLAGNTAEAGGGIWAEECTISFNQVTVADNTSSSDGGGLALHQGVAVFHEATVEGNSASGDGGGLWTDGTVEIDDSSVINNIADRDGGGIRSAGETTVRETTIAGNTAGGMGGGAWLAGVSSIDGVALEDNSADSGAGLALNGQLEGINTVVSDNIASGAGGGATFLANATGTLSAMTFTNNTAGTGGGMAFVAGSALDLHNLIMNANRADAGGGVACTGTAEAELVNVVITDNDAPEGAALFTSDLAALTVDSSILSHNHGGDSVSAKGSSAVTLRYSDVFVTPESGLSPGAWTDGGGNLELDPLFVNLTADFDGSNDDLHLTPDSPCVDTGNPADDMKDLDGSRNDMGAFGGPDPADWPGDYQPCLEGMHFIAIGDSITSYLDENDPTDGPRGSDYYYEDFAFHADKGDSLVLYLEASFDPYLYLLGPECTIVDWDDDSGSGYDSSIVYTVLESGYYTAVATSYRTYNTGSFTLTVE